MKVVILATERALIKLGGIFEEQGMRGFLEKQSPGRPPVITCAERSTPRCGLELYCASLSAACQPLFLLSLLLLLLKPLL